MLHMALKNEFIGKNDLNVLLFNYHPKDDTRFSWGLIPSLLTPTPAFPKVPMVLWGGVNATSHSALGTQETQGILPATDHGLTDHDGGIGFSWSPVSSSPAHLRFQVPFPKGDRARAVSGKNSKADSGGRWGYWSPRELPAVQGRMME